MFNRGTLRLDRRGTVCRRAPVKIVGQAHHLPISRLAAGEALTLQLSGTFLNPNRPKLHLTTKRMNMKTLPLCICSMVLAATAFAQSPPAPPAPPVAPSATASASATVGGTLADRIHQK